MTWEVVSWSGAYVLAQFATEASARDYARWRNDGRRRWKVRPIAQPSIS
jgi:hypothetical protein